MSPIPFWMVPVATDSGEIAGNGDLVEPAYVQTVRSKGAPWIRIVFEPKLTHLSGPERAEGTTYMRITSMQDGHSQVLNADTLAQWGYTSAYFNGDTVEIQVFVSKEGSAQVAVAELEVGEILEGGTASICGPTDDRVTSTDGRVGRLMPVGCTAWLFDGKPYAMLTAGHCFNGTTATVVQFNVPPSLSNGTTQNPPPEDQYAVDAASVQWVETGIGNDWGHFGVFANSTTGLAPLVAQGSSFGRTSPGVVPTIRITGFGTDTGTANQTNQTHSGPFDSFAGTTIRYQADTTGGNSGSPVIRTSDGLTVGIHTNAGCFNNGGSVGGANQGTAFNNAGVLNAIANPQGIAAVTTACGLGTSGSCFEAHSTPHCNDADCCTTVCAADPFCCSNSWDSLCVNRAWSDCAQCGVGTLSCYTSHSGPGCEDLTCCQTVCTADPFCCSTSWDAICANSAATNCPGCGNPTAGDCCTAHATPYCSDAACCDTVCAEDPFCCSSSWDGVCANRASFSCTVCVPANDDCGGAQALSVGATLFGNVGATGSTPVACGLGQLNNDVFFTYTANAYGQCTISTCNNATFDTVIGVFTGTCATGLTAVACNDDSTGCSGFTSSVTFPTLCGVQYTVVVGGYNTTARGTGTLTVTQTGTCEPPNDNCAGAVVIGPGPTAFSTNGATGTTAVSCGLGAINRDIWFAYVPTFTGPCTLSTCGAANFDTVIGVFRGGCGAGQTFVACNDDGAGCGLASSVTFDAQCGQVYLISLGGFSASTSTGQGTLTVTPSGPPCSCPADLDGNGFVGAPDLARLLNAWATSDPIADLNNDGIVGAPDLAALLNAWGPC